MSQYYEETVLRYRVYKQAVGLKDEDGNDYPWQLEWSFHSRIHAEEKLERPSYEKEGLYRRKLVDNGEESTIRWEVW